MKTFPQTTYTEKEADTPKISQNVQEAYQLSQFMHGKPSNNEEKSQVHFSDKQSDFNFLEAISPMRKIKLGEQGSNNKRTLLLDLDETLLKAIPVSKTSFLNLEVYGRSSFSIRLSTGRKEKFTILLRPDLQEFLEVVSKDWELVVFTAAEQEYADLILRQIDPRGRFFSKKLYRQHCRRSISGGLTKYIKDIQDRLYEDCILVDDNEENFLANPGQCIPILPFCEYEENDKELDCLKQLLIKLKKAKNIGKLFNRLFESIEE